MTAKYSAGISWRHMFTKKPCSVSGFSAQLAVFAIKLERSLFLKLVRMYVTQGHAIHPNLLQQFPRECFFPPASLADQCGCLYWLRWHFKGVSKPQEWEQMLCIFYTLSRNSYLLLPTELPWSLPSYDHPFPSHPMFSYWYSPFLTASLDSLNAAW